MKARSLKLLIWGLVIVAALLGMRWLSNNYNLGDLQSSVDTYYWYILTAYALLISVRGVLFIPTLPVILMMASSVEPVIMFITTMLASCCSAYLVCLAVDHLDIQKKLDKLPGRTLKSAKRWVSSSGIAAVTGWAFFPLVFTEIIVYLARLSDMTRKQILLGVAIGEGLFIAILIQVTEWVVSVLQ